MFERLTKSIAHTLGLEVSRYRPFGKRRTQLIRRSGVSTVLDVGASRGQYGTALRQSGYGGRIVSFEPVAEAFAQLSSCCAADDLWDCYHVALGDHDGTTTINVASNLASSSILFMRVEHSAAAPNVSNVRSEGVVVSRLDEFLEGLVEPLMLKLDVQGYEDRVIAGATQAFERTALVECELSLARLYDGQARFADMVSRFDDLGFELIDLEPCFLDSRDGRVLSFNGIFQRNGNL